MSLSAELERIAYCGVDCSACADYLGGKCPGCRLTDWKDDPCMPVACCRGRGIEFCGECPDFPAMICARSTKKARAMSAHSG